MAGRQGFEEGKQRVVFHLHVEHEGFDTEGIGCLEEALALSLPRRLVTETAQHGNLVQRADFG